MNYPLIWLFIAFWYSIAVPLIKFPFSSCIGLLAPLWARWFLNLAYAIVFEIDEEFEWLSVTAFENIPGP